MWVEVAVIVVGVWLAMLAAMLLCWTKLDRFERGAREALHAVQYQLAFIAGAIHLKPQELKKAAAAEAGAPLPEDAETQVLGGVEWSDLEETIARFERGELEFEHLQDAEKAFIDAYKRSQRQ